MSEQPPAVPLLDYQPQDVEGALDRYSFDRYMVRQACTALMWMAGILGTLEILSYIVAACSANTFEGSLLLLVAVLAALVEYGLALLIIWAIRRAVWKNGKKSPYVAIVLGIIGLLGDVAMLVSLLFVWDFFPPEMALAATILFPILALVYAFIEWRLVFHGFRIVHYHGSREPRMSDRQLAAWHRARNEQTQRPSTEAPQRAASPPRWTAGYLHACAGGVLAVCTGIYGLAGSHETQLPRAQEIPKPAFTTPQSFGPDVYDHANGLPRESRDIILAYCEAKLNWPADCHTGLDEFLRRWGQVMVGKTPVMSGRESDLFGQPPRRPPNSATGPILIFKGRPAIFRKDPGVVAGGGENSGGTAGGNWLNLGDGHQGMWSFHMAEKLAADLKAKTRPEPPAAVMNAVIENLTLKPFDRSYGYENAVPKVELSIPTEGLWLFTVRNPPWVNLNANTSATVSPETVKIYIHPDGTYFREGPKREMSSWLEEETGRKVLASLPGMRVPMLAYLGAFGIVLVELVLAVTLFAYAGFMPEKAQVKSLFKILASGLIVAFLCAIFVLAGIARAWGATGTTFPLTALGLILLIVLHLLSVRNLTTKALA